MMEPPVKVNHEVSLHFGSLCDVSRSMRSDGVHSMDSTIVMNDGLRGLVKFFV